MLLPVLHQGVEQPDSVWIGTCVRQDRNESIPAQTGKASLDVGMHHHPSLELLPFNCCDQAPPVLNHDREGPNFAPGEIGRQGGCQIVVIRVGAQGPGDGGQTADNSDMIRNHVGGTSRVEIPFLFQGESPWGGEGR